MTKRIKVHGVARKEPDVRLYVLALVELIRRLEAEERETFAPGTATTAPGGKGVDL
jgi:hypothetical protein